jgi:hypothetical protein
MDQNLECFSRRHSPHIYGQQISWRTGAQSWHESRDFEIGRSPILQWFGLPVKILFLSRRLIVQGRCIQILWGYLIFDSLFDRKSIQPNHLSKKRLL